MTRSFVLKLVPSLLSSLLHRMHAGILVMLLVVLPLQGVVQLVAGVQGHRHMHTGAAQAAVQGSFLSSLTQPVRALLNRLHAAQDPRLKGSALSWVPSSGPADGWHEHGGVFHKHSHETHDVVDLADTADDAAQGGVTAFLAWLPSAPVWADAQREDRPAAAPFEWRDRVVEPPLAPPRS